MSAVPGEQAVSPRHRGVLAGLLLLAAALKILALWYGGTAPDADEAIVGMMAQSMLQGRFTIFYWGQDYMAPVESAALLPLLALFGSHGWCIKLLALVFFLLFLHSTWVLGKRSVGPGPALLAVALLAVSPLFLHIWGLKLRGGFISLCAAGQYLLAHAVDRAGAPTPSRPRAQVLLGTAMGFLLYWYFLAVEYVAVAGLLLLRRPGRKWHPKAVFLGALGFLAWMVPVLVYNLDPDHRWGTFRYFGDHGLDGWKGLKGNAGRLLGSDLPILWGVMGPWTHDVPFDSPVEKALALVLLGTGAAGTLWLAFHAARVFPRWLRGQEGGCKGYAPLGMVALACVGAFLFTGFGEWVEPRFLLPLYGPLSLALADLLWRRRALGMPVAAVVMVCTTVASGRSNGTYWNQPVHRAEIERPFPDPGPFAEELLRRGLVGVYGDYWFCKPMLFLTESRLACTDQYSRTPWMKARVMERARVEKVYLKDEGRSALEDLNRVLDGLMLRAERTPRGGLVMVYHLEQSARAVPYRALTLAASQNAKEVALATDLDVETRWTTRKKQSEEAFTLDLTLDGPRRLEQLVVWSGTGEDHPRELHVEGSRDGGAWEELGQVKQDKRPPHGLTRVPLAERWVDRVRLRTAKAEKVDAWWSVHELTLVERPAPKLVDSAGGGH